MIFFSQKPSRFEQNQYLVLLNNLEKQRSEAFGDEKWNAVSLAPQYEVDNCQTTLTVVSCKREENWKNKAKWKDRRNCSNACLDTVAIKEIMNMSPSIRNMTMTQLLELEMSWFLSWSSRRQKSLFVLKLGNKWNSCNLHMTWRFSLFSLFSLFFMSHLLLFQSSARLPKRTTLQMTRWGHLLLPLHCLL